LEASSRALEVSVKTVYAGYLLLIFWPIGISNEELWRRTSQALTGTEIQKRK